MNTFDIYVHGTPRGHQIWGSEHSHDYISTFYNHDSQASEKVVLQIDICGGDSFYTYIRHQNVFDVEGRPQAFFALTVGFRKALCSNVYRLYQLFDAVYNQICLGSILKQSGNGESYLVADLTAARSGANATVDKIQAAFTQKIAELIVPTLQSLSSGDTFNRTKKTISLLEVDSPLFFDYLKKYSVIVSPNMQPAAIAYDTVAAELKQVSAQKKALSSSNEQLQSDIETLSQENKSLSNQLQSSSSSTEKKYRSKLERLQGELAQVTSERDSLKRKIQEATSSIELIDQPFQKLTRLMAGRFPEKGSSRRNDPMGEQPEANKKDQKSSWSNWINSILLGIVLVICCVILVLVLRNSASETANIEDTTAITTMTVVDENNDENLDETITGVIEQEAGVVNYSDWKDCTIDVVGSHNDIVKKNRKYTVKVCLIGWRKANVPSGTWLVDMGDNVPINTDGGDSFSVPNDLKSGTNLLIQYIYNNNPVVTRTVTVE